MGMMSSLFAGVSGLNAMGTDLSVIGNNIANMSTVGFKSSTATFADLISSSISGGSGSIQTGIGVSLTAVEGNFAQGSLATSSNVLDMAIDGNGFFVVKDPQGGTLFSRAGSFRLDQNNNVVDPTGLKLQGYLADATGAITGSVGDVNLPSTTASPKATDLMFLGANLNSATAVTGVKDALIGTGASVTTSNTGSAPTNDSFTISLNGEAAQTVTVGNGLTGAALATAIQNAVRALPPADPFHAAAYTGFTASVSASNIFTFTSGLAGATNNSTAPGTVVIAANGTDTLATNLNMVGTSPAGTNFDLTNPTGTSDFSTPMTVYDSLGNSHLLTTYFTNVGNNTWNYNVTANSSDVVTANYNAANMNATLGITRVGAGTLTFSTNGALDRESVALRFNTGTAAGVAGTVPGKLQVDFIGATANQPITYNFGTSVTTDGGSGLDGTTQFGSQSAVVQQTQDGYAAGALQAFSIDQNGVINGRFSNGQLRVLAQVVLARFSDPEGLTRTGNNTFAQSGTSGQAVTGTPNGAGLGALKSNSLELSNADLGQSFIDMIAAERGFQANSKVITTVDTMLQTLINIRQ